MYDSTFIAIPAGDSHPHDASFEDVQNALSSMGYVSNRIDTEVTATECLEYLASSEIFYSRSHGSKTCILLNDEYLTVSNVNGLAENTLDNCSLVLYGACLTGQDREGANNLVNETCAKGVTTVIGFDSSVYCKEVNIWSTAFFTALSSGSTVEAACHSADEAVQEEWSGTITTNSWYIAGSKTQILHGGE
jgi:hypothetical protein